MVGLTSGCGCSWPVQGNELLPGEQIGGPLGDIAIRLAQTTFHILGELPTEAWRLQTSAADGG